LTLFGHLETFKYRTINMTTTTTTTKVNFICIIFALKASMASRHVLNERQKRSQLAGEREMMVKRQRWRQRFIKLDIA